jgi:hypothetical protein
MVASGQSTEMDSSFLSKLQSNITNNMHPCQWLLARSLVLVVNQKVTSNSLFAADVRIILRMTRIYAVRL